MKTKSVKKVVIILCFLCLFTYGLPRINFGAEASGGSGSFFTGVRSVTEEEIHQYAADNYLTNYFCNLRYNLGDNPAFYCVFVAAAMQLSFYDNWLNNDIISPIYKEETRLEHNSMMSYSQIESPGVYSFYNGTTFDEDDFMYMLARKNDYYMHDDLKNARIPEEISLGLDYVGIGNDFNFDYESNIIEAIDNGIPVMVCIYGHASIAFAYNSNTNELYLHSGYKENNSFGYDRLVAIDKESHFLVCGVLTPSSNVTHPEECEGNYLYVDENGNTTAHCPCELEEHPAHLGKYAHGYTYTTGGHTETCPVNGEIATCEHTLQMNGNYGETTHQKACVCGYAVEEAHAIALWYVDEERHQKTCACGYQATELHECEYYCLNGGWHSVYCACFGEQNEPHYPHYEVVLLDGEYYYQCTACGYTEPYYSLG